MKKILLLPCLAVSLLASPNDTSVKVLGIKFTSGHPNAGGLSTSTEDTLIGCSHGRRGSNLAGYNDCTTMKQIYTGNTGIAGYPISDPLDFRDNVWCISADKTDILGKKINPSPDEYANYINSDEAKTAISLKGGKEYRHDTEIYKYDKSHYQESYQDFKVNTTGIIVVKAKNQDDKNFKPFSFYLTNNLIKWTHPGFEYFANMRIGTQAQGVHNDYHTWSNLEAKPGKNRQGRDPWGEGKYCNMLDPNTKQFSYGGGCQDDGPDKNIWERDRSDQYVIFYNFLERAGCRVIQYDKAPTNYDDIQVSAQRGDSYLKPLWSGTEVKWGDGVVSILPYRAVSQNGAQGSQLNGDKTFRAQLYDQYGGLAKFVDSYYSSDTCKAYTETMYLKNIGVYDSCSNGNDMWYNLYRGVLAHKGKVGKCYFMNLQYYDNELAGKNIRGLNLFYDTATKRFLQNYTEKGSYASVVYSIHRGENGVYKDYNYHSKHNYSQKNNSDVSKPGHDVYFSLNMRPTSYRFADERNKSNSPDGKIDGRFYINFIPDLKKSGIKLDKLDGESEVKIPSGIGIKSGSYPTMSSNEEGKKLAKIDIDESVVKQIIELSDYICGANKPCFDLEIGYTTYPLKKSPSDKGIYELVDKKDSGRITITGNDIGNYNSKVKLDKDKYELILKRSIVEELSVKKIEDDLNTNQKPKAIVKLTLNKITYSKDKRPFFEPNSKVIIPGDIISSNDSIFVVGDIPEAKDAEFGTIYDKNNPNEEVKSIENGNLVPDKAYTRVEGQLVQLGIKDQKAKDDHLISVEINKYYDKANKIENITDDFRKNIKVYKNGLKTEEIINRKYYYPLNSVISIRDLPIGKYKICYNLYSKKSLLEETEDKKAEILKQKCTNIFSIRASKINYSSETNKFNALENAKNGGKEVIYSAKGISSKNVEDYYFGISEAILKVADRNGDDLEFALNATNNKIVSDDNIVDFNKGSDDKPSVKIKINFPFAVNKTKIELYEGKFIKDDKASSLCDPNRREYPNTIDEKGQVSCYGKTNSMEADFASKNTSFDLGKQVIGNVIIGNKILFKTKEDDKNSLLIPIQILNESITNSKEFVYRKYDEDFGLNVDFGFSNTTDGAKNRYHVKVDDSFINNFTSINEDNKVSLKIDVSADKVNKVFYDKLDEYHKQHKDKDFKIDTFAAKKDDIEVKINLGFSKYYEVKDGKTISDKTLNKQSVPEFSIEEKVSISKDDESKVDLTLDNEYSFIFTGITYKDKVATHGATSATLDPVSDLKIYYFDKRNSRQPIEIKDKVKLNSILNNLSLIADYQSILSFDSDNRLNVFLNDDNKTKQYVKEVIHIDNSDDFQGNRFTVEFIR